MVSCSGATKNSMTRLCLERVDLDLNGFFLASRFLDQKVKKNGFIGLRGCSLGGEPVKLNLTFIRHLH